ncbi:MAG: hypothetical protein ACO1OC_05010 [Tuberibacillus sp.]
MLEEDWDWYGRLFMSLGAEAKVLEPQMLKDFIVNETERLLDCYKDQKNKVSDKS